MKRILIIGWISLSAAALPAQEGDLETVKRQLKDATENFQKAMEQQRQIIDALTKKVNALEAQQAAATNQQAELRKTMQADGLPPGGVGSNPPPSGKSWSP